MSTTDASTISYPQYTAWVLDHFGFGHTVRDEAIRNSQAALLHRFQHFGLEHGFSLYTTQELANISTMCPSTHPFTNHVISRLSIHAAFEHHTPVLELLAHLSHIRPARW
ncbi:MAG: hypothetical protein ACYTF0_07465, partial [Planctomycetota bacterium]